MKKLFLILTLLSSVTLLRAQNDTIVTMSDGLSRTSSIKADRPVHPLTDKSHLLDTLQPWEFHLSLGTGFVGSGFSSATFSGITPSVVYRPNDKWTIRASATMLHSYTLAPDGYAIQGRRPRSMAPLRDPNPMALALNVSATYKVNDRLWLAAKLMRLNGGLASGAILNPWFAPDMPVDLNATAVSAAMRYRFGDDNYLDIHMSFINDHTGALGPLLFGGPYGSPYYYHSTTFGSNLFNEW
ncbi:MAG: hypothetical protein IIY87_05290 [Bacteroidales bacterium]|nr:hypothetical protein [Bacteroidales bacterium]